MATALVTQIAYAVQTLFDPAGTAGRLVDLGKLANYGLLTSFTPAALFTTGVNGAWYDPSDFSTMFQDAAGTVPVTAVGQPVGRILDKSGRGNHAFNPSGNSANFPVLSARYNLLTQTEDFSSTAWSKFNVNTGVKPVVTQISGSPVGTPTTVSKVVFSAPVSGDQSGLVQAPTIGVSSQHLGTFYVKADGAADVGKTIAFRHVAGTAYTLVTLTADWKKVSAVETGSIANFEIMLRPSSGTSSGTVTAQLWGADLRVSNDALNQPAYQRVNTATDYDTVGFKPYLSFNGVNQGLQTNSIDFTYGDKVFVCAGVRKLSDAVIGIAFELSASLTTNIGAFAVAAPLNNSGSTFGFASKGTTFSTWSISGASFSAPSTVVLSGIGDISGSIQTLRLNASQVQNIALSQGTGNYGNYPLYIGARGGSSFFFNGRLYGLVVAGKQASASEIASTEAWLNQKTGAY